MPSHSLEKIDIFVLSKELNERAYPVIRNVRDFAYRNQMTRSCLSVPSNIAEGYGRRNAKVFALFLDYSLGSLYEFRIQLELAVRNKLTKPEQAEHLFRLVDELIPKVINFQKTLRNR